MGLRADDQYLVTVAEEISYYLTKSGATWEDSRDVAQDILIKVLEAELLLPPHKLRSWMYRSAIRLYIDRYRRDRRYHQLLEQAFFDSPNPYDQPDYDFLYEALGQLAEAQRLVLDSYYFQGFSVKEMAHLLGYSQAKVKILLHRGRKHLKDLLERQGYSHDQLNEL